MKQPRTAGGAIVACDRFSSLSGVVPAELRAQRSRLRRDLVGRLQAEAKVPVEHVVVEPSDVRMEVQA